MRVFVHRENVRHLRRLLDASTDEKERVRLNELLAEEMASLAIEEAKARPGPGSMTFNRK